MSVQSVYDFLYKNKGEKFSITQLMSELNISRGSITNSIRNLKKRNDYETEIILKSRFNQVIKNKDIVVYWY